MTSGDDGGRCGRPPTVVSVSRRRVLPLAALAALGVAACSSSGDDASRSTAEVVIATVPVVDTAADPLVSTAGTMGDTMGGASADGFCGLVTVDDLAVLFPDGTPGELTSDDGPVCTWPVGDGQVRWSVETGSYTSLESAAGSGIDRLDGIGDQSFFDGTALVAQAGETVYAVRYTAGTGGITDRAAIQDVLMQIGTRLVAGGAMVAG